MHVAPQLKGCVAITNIYHKRVRTRDQAYVLAPPPGRLPMIWGDASLQGGAHTDASESSKRAGRVMVAVNRHSQLQIKLQYNMRAETSHSPHGRLPMI
jgi:hypothetical protein